MSYAANEIGVAQWVDAPTIDLQLPASHEAPTRTLLAGSTHLEAWAFSNTKNQELLGSFTMPHGYVPGSAVEVHIDCCSNAATNGNVYWRLSYAILQANGEMTAEQELFLELPVAVAGPNGRPVVTHGNFPSIPGTGLAMGRVIRWCLTRMASEDEDTHEDDVIFLHLHLHHQVAWHGSITPSTQT